MKKKIAVLGSTGSIGKSLLNIISKDKNSFNVVLLTANKNYKFLLKQAKEFNVKNLIITNKKSFYLAKPICKKNNIKLFNNFKSLDQFLKNKIDYVMSSIVGLDGLIPTYEIIKYTKKIAIANKESIICAWNIIKHQMLKHKTEFIPVDSEHFSIWYALKKNKSNNLDKIYLTASGGPLLNVPINEFKNVKKNKIINHPNWVMGPKISVDSSTMINKVFEIIEAKKIFNLDYEKLNIIIHPSSYVHAILKFNDGLIKLIAHDTTMEIPIFNSLYTNKGKAIKTEDINFNKLNKLNFQKLNKKKFLSIKILKYLPKKNSLFETALVSANDEIVRAYLEKKISYNKIIPYIMKILDDNNVKKLKKILPTKISQVINVSEFVRHKINLLLVD
ncbi:1-deoxy-D-xylulose-5-phosphate reductoisomerase [Candidatus Pelagibacter sp. HIMB1715]|uniref:1-deoxy-D-xylulose-5-phosphate reductoisomerase n=1 Tax=Candidatus Pelagibacter sp. HIMB1715 TaxID=3413369 RepID=UPI003F839B86